MRKWWHVLAAAGALLDGALALMVVGLHYGEDAWTDRGPRRTPRPTASWSPILDAENVGSLLACRRLLPTHPMNLQSKN